MLVWQQADGLAKRGHQVLLVAPVGSIPPIGVELHGTTLGESEMAAYSGYWQKLQAFDAVLDSSWQKWSYILKAEGKLKAPVLGVLHAPAETMFGSPPPVEKPCIVAISKDQAGAVAGQLGVTARLCYNAVNLDSYKPNGKPRTNRYLFLARMSRLKGPHVAAAVAKTCGVPIDLVGDDKLVENPQYVAQIKAMAEGSRIVYHGEKSRKECAVFMAEAKAMLHCSFIFREPFGLAPVEAQASGCPVIAPDFGAMRETVKHGETGFLVKTMEEMEELVRTDAVLSINPEACREWASQFSLKRMIDRWEELIKEAVETGGW
jgi:glycosyltransferase involved in cell wall biosynthesis